MYSKLEKKSTFCTREIIWRDNKARIHVFDVWLLCWRQALRAHAHRTHSLSNFPGRLEFRMAQDTYRLHSHRPK